jgi:hypothetical protein
MVSPSSVPIMMSRPGVPTTWPAKLGPRTTFVSGSCSSAMSQRLVAAGGAGPTLAPAMPAPVMAVAEAATAMMPMKRKMLSLFVAGGPSDRSR